MDNLKMEQLVEEKARLENRISRCKNTLNYVEDLLEQKKEAEKPAFDIGDMVFVYENTIARDPDNFFLENRMIAQPVERLLGWGEVVGLDIEEGIAKVRFEWVSDKVEVDYRRARYNFINNICYRDSRFKINKDYE